MSLSVISRLGIALGVRAGEHNIAVILSRARARANRLITSARDVRWQTTDGRESSSTLDKAGREEANYTARVDLAAAYRALDYYNYNEGVDNHLSLRAPSRIREEDVMLLIPYGLHWKEVTASCLIGVDFHTGEVVEGEGSPAPTAPCLHAPIHNTRYTRDGITVVMHTHQPHATAIACMSGPEPFQVDLSQTSMRYLDMIAYDGDYSGFLDATAEGERMARVLGDKHVLMLGQHGVLAVGRRACDAVDLLYYLERSAQIQLLVMSSGAKALSATPDVVKSVAADDCYEHGAQLHFDCLKRILAKDEPSFMS